jgi:hypothetical protein
VYPREPESMKELREVTAKHPWYACPSMIAFFSGSPRSIFSGSMRIWSERCALRRLAAGT